MFPLVLMCCDTAQLPTSWCATEGFRVIRAQELCESQGGCPGLPVPNSPYGLCGRKAAFEEEEEEEDSSSELRGCVISRGGRPGLPVPNSPQYGICGL